MSSGLKGISGRKLICQKPIFRKITQAVIRSRGSNKLQSDRGSVQCDLVLYVWPGPRSHRSLKQSISKTRPHKGRSKYQDHTWNTKGNAWKIRIYRFFLPVAANGVPAVRCWKYMYANRCWSTLSSSLRMRMSLFFARFITQMRVYKISSS